MDFDDDWDHDKPSFMTAFHEAAARPRVASSSASAAYGILIVLGIYFLLQYLDYANLPFSESIWNILIYLSPSSLLGLVDEDVKAAGAHSQVGGFHSQVHARKSKAMRRLLGLDTPGILTTFRPTRALSDLGGVSRNERTEGLPGLGNWDHSCYQNSVIQGLASLETLREYLRRRENTGDTSMDDEGKGGPTTVALRRLLESLNDHESLGKTLWTPSALKSMSSWQQQDAQEYFSKLMDGLEFDLAKLKKRGSYREGLKLLCTTDGGGDDVSESSAPQDQRASHIVNELQAIKEKNPLDGLLAQRVGCQQCGYVEGLSLVPFNCLTVPLGNQRAYDVRDCLDEYTALESINGVECARCTLLRTQARMERIVSQIQRGNDNDAHDTSNPQRKALQEESLDRLNVLRRTLDDADFTDTALKKCQIPANQYVSTTKSRQAGIARAPKALVVHINRSVFNEHTGEQSKNHAIVEFPLRLNLGSWCLGRQQSASVGDESYECWSTDPRSSMLRKDDSDGELKHDSSKGITSSVQYELRAIVTHYGRHENGHYICYRRSPNTMYGDADDDQINAKAVEQSSRWWRLSDEEVTQVSEETVLSQGGVFMLFYERLLATADGPAHLDNPKWPCDMIERTAVAHHNDIDHINSSSAKKHAVETPDLLTSEIERQRSKSISSPTLNLKNHLANSETERTSIDMSAAEQLTSTPYVTASRVLPATESHEHDLGSVDDVEVRALASQDNTRSAPSPSAVVSPRAGRRKGRRPGKAMEPMAGFVQAN